MASTRHIPGSPQWMLLLCVGLSFQAQACYRSLLVERSDEAGSDAAGHDGSVVTDANMDAHIVVVDAAITDAIVPDMGADLGIHSTRNPPEICVTGTIQEAQFELTETAYLVLHQGSKINHWQSNWSEWVPVGGEVWSRSSTPNCTVRLSGRNGAAVETGTCVGGIFLLSPSGRTLELSNAMATFTADSTTNHAAAIVSTNVLVYRGGQWNLQSDMASKVGTNTGDLVSVAVGDTGVVWIAVGRNLFRSVDPKLAASQVRSFGASIADLATDPLSDALLVATADGQVQVLSGDQLSTIGAIDGSVKEAIPRGDASWILRSRKAVYATGQGSIGPLFIAENGQWIADIDVNSEGAFALVVDDLETDPCHRVSFVEL